MDYNFNYESTNKYPSWLQVIRNYENAILKLGGKKIYSDNFYATFKMTKNGKDIWVMLSFITGTDLETMGFWLHVIEIEAMKQEIVANEIYTALNNDGYIALYLNFATGKSTIEPESDKQIDEIVEMLKTNSSLKISIEGHTDNTGDEKSNQTLSEDRAKAVMNAIIAKGVDKNRLSSKGWGQSKPIADNRTEDGKAKNRRVEIVKK